MAAQKSAELFKLLAGRRSYYALSSSSPIPDSKIREIASQALQTVPSAFNSQTTRLVLLLGAQHQKLWDITAEILRAHMGEEKWAAAPTAKKLNGFRSGYGTILFLEDQAKIRELQGQFKSYAAHFPDWSDHTSGMHQLAIWTALEAEGFGANLQHYNPVIDERVRAQWSLPDTWTLRSQLVFGKPEEGVPAPKDKLPLDETLKVFGA